MSRSANPDHFAAEADLRAVPDFAHSPADARAFESRPEYGAELREFRSTDEPAAAFPRTTRTRRPRMTRSGCTAPRPDFHPVSAAPGRSRGHSTRCVAGPSDNALMPRSTASPGGRLVEE